MGEIGLDGIDGLDGLKALMPLTRLLIERNWPEVERIAAALIVNKTLNYEQAVSLIDECKSD